MNPTKLTLTPQATASMRATGLLPTGLARALHAVLQAWRARSATQAARATLDRLDAHTLRDIGLCDDVIDAVREHRRADAARWLGHGGGAY